MATSVQVPAQPSSTPDQGIDILSLSLDQLNSIRSQYEDELVEISR